MFSVSISLVWNGYRLGKEFSANSFHNYWNDGGKPDITDPGGFQQKGWQQNDLPPEKPHELFGFLNTGLVEGLWIIAGNTGRGLRRTCFCQQNEEKEETEKRPGMN